MKNHILTQDILKTLLHYSEETGEFTWIKTRAGTALAGSIAGNIHIKGYRIISIFGKLYKAHRLAWLYTYGKWPEDQIDHINGNRDDNRIDNLRDVSSLENSRNSKIRCTNKSGVTGICRYKRNNKWVAQISVKGKVINLGHFDNFNDAVIARKMAETKHGFHENHGRQE